MATDWAAFGAGAQGELEKILAQKRLEQLDRAAREDRMRATEMTARREAEDRRRWDATHALSLENSKALREQREAAAADRAAVTQARTARDQFIEGLTSNPASFYAMPKPLRIIRAGQHGISMGEHAVESPDEHKAHLTAERDGAFAEWKRRQDYDEQQLRSRPARPSASTQLAPGADDPAFPRGVQDYVLQLRSKYNTFDEAADEFNRAMGDLRAAHPNLSTAKALTALRQSFTGSGRTAAAGGDPRVAAVVAAVSGGGRGVNPSQSSGALARAPQVPNSNGMSEAQLQEVARAAIRQRIGREPSAEEVKKVLANPANRKLLMTGGK